MVGRAAGCPSCEGAQDARRRDGRDPNVTAGRAPPLGHLLGGPAAPAPCDPRHPDPSSGWPPGYPRPFASSVAPRPLATAPDTARPAGTSGRRPPAQRRAATHLRGAPGGAGARRGGAAAGEAPGPAHPARGPRRAAAEEAGAGAPQSPVLPLEPCSRARPPRRSDLLPPSFPPALLPSCPGSNPHVPPAPRPLGLRLLRLLPTFCEPTLTKAGRPEGRGHVPREAWRQGETQSLVRWEGENTDRKIDPAGRRQTHLREPDSGRRKHVYRSSRH